MTLELEDDTTAQAAADVRAARGDARGTGTGQSGRKRGPYKKRTTRASASSETKTEREPYKPTETSLAASSLLAATVWKIAGPMLKLSSLTPDEADQLGAALDPILAKYVPALDDFREEITLAVVVAGAFEATRRRYKEEHPTPARHIAVPGEFNGNAREVEATVVE